MVAENLQTQVLAEPGIPAFPTDLSPWAEGPREREGAHREIVTMLVETNWITSSFRRGDQESEVYWQADLGSWTKSSHCV